MTITRFGVPKIHAEPVDGGFSFERTVAIEQTQAWLEHRDASLLVLSGTVGTGKSQAAALAVGRFWEEICEAQPWSQARRRGLPLWLPAPLITRAAPWDEAPKAWEAAGLLVLDDLGEEDTSDKTRIAIATLINARWGSERRTLITTNLDAPTFAARYGQRTTDRIRQSGVTKDGKSRWWVKCLGESMRGSVRPLPPELRPEQEEGPAISDEALAEADALLAEMADGVASAKRVSEPIDIDKAKARIAEQVERRKREDDSEPEA